MEVIIGIERLTKPFLNPIVTLGNFDGVHLGHQRIFERVKEEARSINGESVVITFEPHPLKILDPENCPPLLTPFRKKVMFIEKTGIEKLICIQFSIEFSEISPSDFIQNILMEKVNTKKIIVGYNYRFGKGKTGDVEFLKNKCKDFNIEVVIIEALKIDNTVVSSSKIREFIKNGDVDKASKFLGRDYPIFGRVVEGTKRGKILGFPTANLEIAEELYPKTGVYAVEVEWNQMIFNGLANVGFNPTFLKNDLKRFSLEVHILDFNKDIYGEEIKVNFKRRIRDEIRFDSPELLIDQIRKDIQWAKEKVFKN